MEVEPGADRKRERQHRDERERGEHSAEAGSDLALPIQPGAPEDEDGDERQKGEPVECPVRDRVPERRIVADPRLAEGERRIQGGSQPGQVEDAQSAMRLQSVE